jgi:lactate dehydrogenase-like 2-hydroxyacid dehydrogenase
MIGARNMRPTAILVNTSRRPVVDEPALAEALAERVFAGAGLDVYERAARRSAAAEVGERGAGAAYRQRVGGHPHQYVDDGGGECSSGD